MSATNIVQQYQCCKNLLILYFAHSISSQNLKLIAITSCFINFISSLCYFRFLRKFCWGKNFAYIYLDFVAFRDRLMINSFCFKCCIKFTLPALMGPESNMVCDVTKKCKSQLTFTTDYATNVWNRHCRNIWKKINV